MPKAALIAGSTGQDGAHLAKFLLDTEYAVHGLRRRSFSPNTGRIADIRQDRHDPLCFTSAEVEASATTARELARKLALLDLHSLQTSANMKGT